MMHRWCVFARRAGVVLAVAALPFAVHASSLGRFERFLTTTQSARGTFRQTVVDQDGRIVQRSSGTFAFQRPGRFRWTYKKPYAQLIVGDGTRVWIYDPDLQQVTVKRMDRALTSTPAALLAGNNEAMRAFTMSDQGEQDGLDWLEAVPHNKEGGFKRVRIGFGPHGLEAMEFYDTFGQKTLLRISELERNPRLDPSLFRFSPPKGADVIGE